MSNQPVPDSVRLAWPSEATSVVNVQRRAWGERLPAAWADALLTGLTAEEMADSWQQAITRPPQSACRVLVAVDASRVVGFATTMPSSDVDAEAGDDGEINEFVIDPIAEHRGHGSRLLNACADTLRADGFKRASWWLAAVDDNLRGFLTAAGWSADGASREIGSDDGDIRVKQIRLHTDLATS